VSHCEDKTLERIVTSAEECDLSHATLSPELSATGMDQAAGRFFATVDKVNFRSVAEIVGTVLEAHHFALNLENLLACLEQFQIGARVRLKSTGFPPVAKAFYPCVQFQLPAKSRVGPLLSKLYEEVERYQAELHGLRQRVTEVEESATVAKLQRENKKLQKENQELCDRLLDCTQRLARLERAQKDTAQALQEQNLLPAHIRFATVQVVDWDRRVVTLKAGPAAFDLWLCNLAAVPRPDQICLVRFQDGNAEGMFLTEGEAVFPAAQMSSVLFVEGDTCKVRDESRREWCIQAQNPREQETLQRLFRGDRLVLYFQGENLFRFHPYPSADPNRARRSVEAALAVHEATRALTPIGFQAPGSDGEET
jgi:hypothetical protein